MAAKHSKPGAAIESARQHWQTCVRRFLLAISFPLLNRGVTSCTEFSKLCDCLLESPVGANGHPLTQSDR